LTKFGEKALIGAASHATIRAMNNPNTGFRRVVRTLSKMRRVLELLEDNDSTSSSKSGLEKRQENRTEAIEIMRDLTNKQK